MDEKPIEKEAKQQILQKKAYTPPALTVYGKLTELTAGGTSGTLESVAMDMSSHHRL